jgi:dipeptidyl aminopeptidase/acylaminoacyl peptidase
MMHPMHCCLGLALSLTAGTLISAENAHGPGFDPTPVQIPDVVRAASRPITIRDLHGLNISPDGKYVAFVVGQAVYETNSYRSGLFVVGTEPGSFPTNLGSAGLPQWDEVNRWMEERPLWTPDSRYVLRRMRKTAGDSWQVWRWNRDGGQPIQVTHVEGDVQTLDMAPDGTKMLFTAQAPRDPALSQTLAASGIFYDGNLTVTASREIVSALLDTKPRTTETWIHVFASGEERIASPDEIKLFGPWQSDLDEKLFDERHPELAGRQVIDAKVSPDRLAVAYRYLAEHPADFKGSVYVLFSKPIRGGTPVPLTIGSYFIEDYWWSPDSSKLYYEQVEPDGRSERLMVIPASGGQATPVFSGSGDFFSFSANHTAQYVVAIHQSPKVPGEIALVDVATGRVRTLVDLNPEFENIQLSFPIRLEGLNKYGDAWHAQLVKPTDYEPGKRYPAIVTTYRSRDGFLRGASGDVSPIQVYAAHGFAVLCFDFERDPYSRLRPANFDDFVVTASSPVASIEMAIKKGADMGIVDPARVGITGYSRGTEITAYAITHTNLFRAASGAAGDSSPFFYYIAPDWVKKRFESWGLGGWPEGQAKPRWKEFAPDLNANHIQVPVLNNDPDSEFLNDLSLYTSLKELGKPVELFIYSNEGHTISQPRHRYEIYERNVDWFRFWLKSEEGQESDKKEQYERWHHLRELQQKIAETDDAHERPKK